MFEASPEIQESNWLEWKGPLALTGRGSAGPATIAKAILGFANRDPDVASRSMGGCAYLVAGVSPGDVPGVDVVDIARLETQIASYVGETIDWRADYATFEARSVLVVTVEPPSWGDPIHPARKGFSPVDGKGVTFQNGTVFVRHQARTDQANAAHIDMLSRRAGRRPGDRLAVRVGVGAASRLRAVSVAREDIDGMLARERATLLGPLDSPPSVLDALQAYRGHSRSVLALDGEFRSEDQFRAEVDRYLDDLEDALDSALVSRAVVHGVARLDLEIINDTDQNFTRVRVEAQLPPGLSVSEWPGDHRERAELPQPPVRYGEGRRERFAGLGVMGTVDVSSLRPGALNPWWPEITTGKDTIIVDFVPEDVRPRGRESLPTLWLVVSDPAMDSVSVSWEATATNVDGRLSGDLSVPVICPPVGLAELLEPLPEEESSPARG